MLSGFLLSLLSAARRVVLHTVCHLCHIHQYHAYKRYVMASGAEFHAYGSVPDACRV